MMLLCSILVLLLASPMYSAPSNNNRNNQQTQTQKVNDKTAQLAPSDEANNENKMTTSGQRQKRWFNYYGYGFPPVNPIIYPNGNKRDGASGYFVPGSNDPYQQIYQRLQEISTSVRFSPAPISPQFPFFFPVIFVPQIGCGCNPTKQNTTNNTPGVDTRFPVLDDSRQNWGFITNNDIDRPSVNNDDYDEEISRPISFDPVRPNRPSNRPMPPVDHGTSQAGSAPTVTGVQPVTGQGRPVSPTTTRPTLPPRPPQPSSRPAAGRPTLTTIAPALAPSACDAAVLSCCHQLQITFDCFVSQGCTNPASLGAPCDANVILSVIEKFQRFYGQRT